MAIMVKSCKFILFFLIISRISVYSKSLYSKGLDNQKLEVRQLDTIGQIVPGLIGTAVGSAGNAGIGSIVGGIVAPIIGNIVTSAVDNLISNMRDEQVFATGRDAPLPYDSYVVNIPNMGPYVLLVPRSQEVTEEDVESSENKDKPGSQDKGAPHLLGTNSRSPSAVRVIPYKSFHIVKKPSGSSQVKLFHPSQN